MTPAGDLALVLPDGGRLLQKKPVVYQEIAGQRLPVEGKYRLSRHGAQVTFGFALAAYDKTSPLVIDPKSDLFHLFGRVSVWMSLCLGRGSGG